MKLDDLIKLAQEKQPTTSGIIKSKVDDKIYRFVTYFKIKQGKYKMPADALFKAFKLWYGLRNIDIKDFRKQFNLYFVLEKRHYMLNMSAISLLNKIDNLIIERRRYVKED